jgi:RNA polymerase sigma-70 factor (sigma-E family)
MRVAEVDETVRSSFGKGFEAYAVGDMARLTRLASMLVKDRDKARDLVQETLVQVGCAWSRIDREGNPGGYATTTMSRLAWRQTSRARTEWTLLNRHAPTETAPDDFSRVDDAASLRAAMDQLGPRQRAVLVLRFHQDLSEAAVAETLGCSVGTVKSQTARGLANVRARLQRQTEQFDDQIATHSNDQEGA